MIRNHSHGRSAFTLIELLVVIAIIAVLISCLRREIDSTLYLKGRQAYLR